MSKIKNPNSPWRRQDDMIRKPLQKLRIRVHAARKEHPEMTHAQIAALVGCAATTVQKILSYKYNVSTWSEFYK